MWNNMFCGDASLLSNVSLCHVVIKPTGNPKKPKKRPIVQSRPLKTWGNKNQLGIVGDVAKIHQIVKYGGIPNEIGYNHLNSLYSFFLSIQVHCWFVSKCFLPTPRGLGKTPDVFQSFWTLDRSDSKSTSDWNARRVRPYPGPPVTWPEKMNRKMTGFEVSMVKWC